MSKNYTKFVAADHWEALRACRDAADFGADCAEKDLQTLDQVASSFAANSNELFQLTRSDFSQAYERVLAAVDEAKKTDPDRAAKVFANRKEKKLSAMTPGQRKHELEKEATAKRVAEDWSNVTKAGELYRKNPELYAILKKRVRTSWEAAPAHLRGRLDAAIGAAIVE